MSFFPLVQRYEGLPSTNDTQNPNTLRARLVKPLISKFHMLGGSQMAVIAFSVILFLFLSIYFYIPSSLYIYVVFFCFTSPALLAVDIWTHRNEPMWFQLTAKRNLLTGAITVFVILCLINDTFFTTHVPSHWRRPTNEKYYIASLLHNSEPILPHYQRSLFRLVKELGPENVFVSIYENDSNDKTPAILRAMDVKLKRMGAQTSIVTTTQPAEVQRKERIERLSIYRNLAMDPLNSVAYGGIDGQPFDKVIWINDVLFESSMSISLMQTLFTLYLTRRVANLTRPVRWISAGLAFMTRTYACLTLAGLCVTRMAAQLVLFGPISKLRLIKMRYEPDFLFPLTHAGMVSQLLMHAGSAIQPSGKGPMLLHH